MSKKLPKKNTIKKSEGFILILILLVFFFVHDHEEYPKKIDGFVNHVFGHVESIERQNRVLFKTIEVLLNDNKNNELLEEICTSIIEDEINPITIAKGYDCLAKINSRKHDPSSIYQAIKNESYALESSFNQKYLNNLFQYITEGYQVNISSNDELQILNELSKSEIKEVKARALYRLSLINSLGRKSSLEDYNYNLEEASNLRNQVLKTINFDQKKYIDVMFVLNNNPKFVHYAKTTIASILLNSDLDSEYRFYVLSDAEDPFSGINQNQLLSLQKINPYTMKFITYPQTIFESKEGFKSLRTRLLFSRFLSENLLGNLDSIISLDVDIIVLRDLYNLQHQPDYDDFILMGAIEGHRERYKSSCEFPYTYINAGVTVENLKLMRQTDNSQLIISKYQDILSSKDSRCISLLEQDVINVLYKNQINFISKRWNHIPAFNYSTKFMPFIIHYAGAKTGLYNEPAFKEIKNLRNKYQEFAENISIK